MDQLLTTGTKKRRASAKIAEPQVSSVTLSAVEPADVAALNAFYRRRLPVTITAGDEAATVGAIWPTEDAGPQESLAIVVEIGETVGSISLPRTLVARWLTKAAPDSDIENLAAAHQALLIEYLLQNEIVWLESQLGRPIQLTSVGEAEATSHEARFSLCLEYADGRWLCPLHIDADVAAQIGRLLDGAQERAAGLLDLPITVSLLRAAADLSVADLRALQVGDVVMIDDIGSDENVRLALFGGHLVAPLRRMEQGGRLISALRPIVGSPWEWMMDQKTQPQPDRADDSGVEDLPITVAFEFGRITMPLGEVSNLASGSVVPLAGISEAAVDILANGKRIGRGEMVRIGDGMGVRIIRMFENA